MKVNNQEEADNTDNTFTRSFYISHIYAKRIINIKKNFQNKKKRFCFNVETFL